MASKKWNQNEKVALDSDISYRGVVSAVLVPQVAGDVEMYSISWEKNGVSTYYGNMLISKDEADKRQAKVEEEKAVKTSISDRFKSIFKSG